jgi:hypothetical protein
MRLPIGLSARLRARLYVPQCRKSARFCDNSERGRSSQSRALDGGASQRACLRGPRATNSASDAASGLTTSLRRLPAVLDSMLELHVSGDVRGGLAHVDRCGVEPRLQEGRARATVSIAVAECARVSELLLRLDCVTYVAMKGAGGVWASIWATLQRLCALFVACRALCVWPRPSGRTGTCEYVSETSFNQVSCHAQHCWSHSGAHSHIVILARRSRRKRPHIGLIDLFRTF